MNPNCWDSFIVLCLVSCAFVCSVLSSCVVTLLGETEACYFDSRLLICSVFDCYCSFGDL